MSLTAPLTLRWKVDGVLTDVASAVLADPTATYGVRNTATSATVIASGAAMTHAATGVYTYNDSSLSDAVGYSWYAKVTDTDGQVLYFPFTKSAIAGTAVSGVYANSGDIINLFGEDNVIAWSNLDNTVTDAIDSVRTQTALTYADSEIDNFFRDGPYTVPLSVGSGVATVTNWAAVIAGVWLYNNRGQATEGQAANQYQQMLAGVRSQMALYKGGTLRLNAARVFGGVSNAPAAACRVMGYGM